MSRHPLLNKLAIKYQENKFPYDNGLVYLICLSYLFLITLSTIVFIIKELLSKPFFMYFDDYITITINSYNNLIFFYNYDKIWIPKIFLIISIILFSYSCFFLFTTSLFKREDLLAKRITETNGFFKILLILSLLISIWYCYQLYITERINKVYDMAILTLPIQLNDKDKAMVPKLQFVVKHKLVHDYITNKQIYKNEIVYFSEETSQWYNKPIELEKDICKNIEQQLQNSL